MAKRRDRVSEAVIRRLPKYYRYITELKNNGVQRVSSNELGQKMGLTASQIRQDFNCFGGFGQQGYGYNVPELHGVLKKIIGLDRQYNMVVIGAGNLGQALANYSGFEKEGFYIKALFDINPRLVGISIRGIDVLDIDSLKSYVGKNHIDIGVICTPKEQAQEIAELLVDCGIKNIWNFAPVDVVLPDDVVVENVHLSDSLYILCYRTGEES